MADGNWGVALAKAKFSELVEKARTEGPQYVSRNGREAVVVVSADEWSRRTRTARTMLEFLDRSPLKGSKIDLERDRDLGRDVEFE
ncbi:MAG TPA: type II toxin-antitoxin system Phd/YefM family antitoxin [Caulobacteraceae bacterium]|nr:type II toxin-antitoxin system Phd/YefM family antitoxin [Caulobacteraceae bacterium]